MHRSVPRTRIVGVFLGLVLLAGSGLNLAERATAHAATHSHVATMVMTIVAGGRLSSSATAHGTIGLSGMSAHAGQQVRVTVYNFDRAMHVFVVPDLGVSTMIAASPQSGVPAVVTFGFEARWSGTYTWWYVRPCGVATTGAAHPDGHTTGTLTVTAG